MNSTFSILLLALFSLFVAAIEIKPAKEDLEPADWKLETGSQSEAEAFDYSSENTEEPLETPIGRFKRATCDLLSVSTPFGSINHAACAGHCIAKRKGYRGGYCSKGVCRCRK